MRVPNTWREIVRCYKCKKEIGVQDWVEEDDRTDIFAEEHFEEWGGSDGFGELCDACYENWLAELEEEERKEEEIA